MEKSEQRKFKPGDDVTVIIRDSDGHGTNMAGGMFVAEVEGFIVMSQYGREYKDFRGAMQWAKFCIGAYGWSGLWAYPAADCYADKMEAEAVLIREGPSPEEQLAAMWLAEDREESGLLEDE